MDGPFSPGGRVAAASCWECWCGAGGLHALGVRLWVPCPAPRPLNHLNTSECTPQWVIVVLTLQGCAKLDPAIGAPQ